MEHKSNSYKVNRQQREKVLRFSIRKYSFGAASVVIVSFGCNAQPCAVTLV